MLTLDDALMAIKERHRIVIVCRSCGRVVGELFQRRSPVTGKRAWYRPCSCGAGECWELQDVEHWAKSQVLKSYRAKMGYGGP